jgi:hypothetical protein
VPSTAATENPEVAVIRTPPATRVTVAGRACAKRMRTPYQCCSLLLRNDLFSMEWHGRRDTPASRDTPPFNTGRRVPRHLPSYPVGGNVITPARNGLIAFVAWSDPRPGKLVAFRVGWFAEGRRVAVCSS